MASSVALNRSRERIAALCQAAPDARQLRLRLLDEMRRVVAFDYYVFVLTDPQTCVGSDPLSDVPLRNELPQLIRLKYATRINRWTTLDNPSSASLYAVTAGQPAQSLVWRELLAPHGIGDIASVVLRDRFGCWGFLDLWRSGTSSPFDKSDVEFLADIAPVVTEGLRRCQAATFLARPSDTLRHTPLVLLMSSDLTMRAQTPETHEYLRILVPPAPGRTPIPAGAYNVAAQLLASEAGVDDHPPCASVHLADGLWLTLRAARIGETDIAVTIERASPAERLAIFSRAHGFSSRETELLDVLSTGADTREAAERMHLSQHTVQDHLKSIFLKTAARSRLELLTRALG